MNGKRADFHRIIDVVERGASVLDLGCGSGDLLDSLRDTKNARVQGVEIRAEGVNACIEKGIDVTHGDLRDALNDFPDGFFDYVILSQTLHAIQDPAAHIKQMARVGRLVLVSFYNLAYLPYRWYFFWKGTFPRDFPYSWQDTYASIITARDFKRFCKDAGLTIVQETYIDARGRTVPRRLANALGQVALVVLAGSPARA